MINSVPEQVGALTTEALLERDVDLITFHGVWMVVVHLEDHRRMGVDFLLVVALMALWRSMGVDLKQML